METILVEGNVHKVVGFQSHDRVALTLEEKTGKIFVWYSAERGDKTVRVFRDSRGAVILAHDGAQGWKRNRKEAENCFYYQFWFGEFPYSSWSYAVRQDKVTQEVVVCCISTDINPRGLTSSDRWKAECLSYVSPAELVMS